MKAKFDDFHIEIFKDDDGDWLARFEEMPNVSAFGTTPEEALLELEDAWEGVKESYRLEGKPIPVPQNKDYSGQFNVRVPKNIHKILATEAEKQNTTLNQLCVSIFSKFFARGIVPMFSMKKASSKITFSRKIAKSKTR